MNGQKSIRRHIREMPPYKPIYPLDVLAEQLGIPVGDLVKLDANENPYGPLPEVREALSRLDTLHIYPDPESRHVRRMLAGYHGISEANLLAGAGADELIDLLIRTVMEPGDVLLNCPPTFGMYAFGSALNQARLVEIPRRPDFSLDMPGILAAVEKYQPRMLFLANPNNPDGGLISDADFSALISLPLLLVLDEAYIQFSGPGASRIRLAPRYENLVVLQTFSKWAGLAGLRVGFGAFPDGMVPVLMKAKQPYNVSVAAQQAAIATLQHVDRSEKRVDAIIAARQDLFRLLQEIPWLEPYPSGANFLLCRVAGREAKSVYQNLRSLGILIRYFDKPGLSDHIRISVGTEAQHEVLLNALQKIR